VRIREGEREERESEKGRERKRDYEWERMGENGREKDCYGKTERAILRLIERMGENASAHKSVRAWERGSERTGESVRP